MKYSQSDGKPPSYKHANIKINRLVCKVLAIRKRKLKILSWAISSDLFCSKGQKIQQKICRIKKYAYICIRFPRKQLPWCGSSAWLECRPVTPEVEGSSPFWVVLWKFSSAGRASALQAEGHRFEPCNFHFFYAKNWPSCENAARVFLLRTAEKMQKEERRDSMQSNCETCMYFGYDEEFEEYFCEVNLDEDEMEKFLTDSFQGGCPYYRLEDEYRTVRKQM